MRNFVTPLPLAPLGRPSRALPSRYLNHTQQLVQLVRVETVPEQSVINQKPVLVKQYPLFFQQLQLGLLVLSARCLFPVALEATDELLQSAQTSYYQS